MCVCDTDKVVKKRIYVFLHKIRKSLNLSLTYKPVYFEPINRFFSFKKKIQCTSKKGCLYTLGENIIFIYLLLFFYTYK